VVVLGVSGDDIASHVAFRDKFGFAAGSLLADPTHAVCEQYGVWRNDPRWGWGVARETFVVGPDGTIRHHFAKVSPAGHAAEVLAALGTR
jgi:peroxiredoxin Q/BCP